MIGSEFRLRPRRVPMGLGVIIALLAGLPAAAQEPLARFVPSDGLAILVEHDGLESRAAAWKGTAAYAILNQTTVGAVIEDITAQLLDRALQGIPEPPATGKDLVGLLEHLGAKGFVVGFCGSLNPPDPRAVVVVIRGAAKNDVFRRVIAKIPPLNEPAATKLDQPGGRKVWDVAGTPLHWWYEKDDVVFSFVKPESDDPVIAVLEGKAKSAIDHPVRAALIKGDGSDVPLGRLFVDLAALPPIPEQGARLGLDGVARVGATWSIMGKAMVNTLVVQAPRPRRGLLALFDQPPIAPNVAFVPPKAAMNFSLASIDLSKTADTIAASISGNDPRAAREIGQSMEKFKAMTGVDARKDLLDKVGPTMAVYAPPGGGVANMLAMWFHPPDLGVVAELKDAKGFAAALEKLSNVANRSLKQAGALVPARPGEPSRPGTDVAELRRIMGPGIGYVLSVPPSVLPTPAGMRPTILVDVERKLVALGGSPATAKAALDSLKIGAAVKPTSSEIAGRIAVAQSDQSGSLPGLLANLPNIVQFVAFAAVQQPPNRGKPAIRIQMDPDMIPDAEAIRALMIPTRVHMTSDDVTVKFRVESALPIPTPSIDAGMESPVLIALLLPAVQSAREAARRSQCVNNLKQIALAMHNYHAATNGFPAAAITDKQGKPLLSWRVAILPYLDQQELYNKFKLDEPWDSPNNKPLIAEMPNLFACSTRQGAGEPGLTPYRGIVGQGAFFDLKQPVSMNAITDGTSNTLMVVEASEAVAWTKPDEIVFKPDDDQAPPLFGFGSNHPGGFNAAMADGSVRFFKTSINPLVLKALITRAGGEVVQVP